jgi:hypothetical protein
MLGTKRLGCCCCIIRFHALSSSSQSFIFCLIHHLTEATYEVLPRLYQIRFDHGVIDEYLFLDMPTECRLPNGLMLLEHRKVVQKSVYEHLHVTHEGHLRIIFTPELKV